MLRDLSRAPPQTYGSALRAVLRIVAHLSSRPAARLQLAYLEVYNDTINDLLPRSDGQGRATGHDLRLRESVSEGVYVEGLQHCEVSSPQQVFTAIAAGNQVRHVAGTNVNSRSSRSHTMLVLQLAQPEVCDESISNPGGDLTGATLHSKLWLVDLAGSERSAATEPLEP